MAVGRTRCVTLLGIDGRVVDVEADVASGLPAFTVTGLPDTGADTTPLTAIGALLLLAGTATIAFSRRRTS
jgi:LPXTG-motif cell wall-anchored protein